MLIEAAKGGHTSVVCYLLDYPNNLLSAPPPDVTQLTPPSHDLNRVRSKTKAFYIISSLFLYCSLFQFKPDDFLLYYVILFIDMYLIWLMNI